MIERELDDGVVERSADDDVKGFGDAAPSRDLILAGRPDAAAALEAKLAELSR